MFSPVAKRLHRNSDINSTPGRSPLAKKKRLDELRGQNSFRVLDTPKKSPEKVSSDEPCTPKVTAEHSNMIGGMLPLMVDVDQGSGDNDGGSLSMNSGTTSPIVNFHHHNYKDKFKPPENKAYRFACAGEVARPVPVDGSGSPHERRYQMKKSGNRDKYVSYTAEYLRPIEEFIYPSLRPSTEELRKKREEAKKNLDFSVPDFDEVEQFDLQWKIEESDSKVERPDLSSTLLYKISAKGEGKLRDSLVKTCRRKIKVEEDYRKHEEHQADLSTGMQKVIRKANIMGSLFGKEATLAPPEDTGFEGTENPHDVVSVNSLSV